MKIISLKSFLSRRGFHDEQGIKKFISIFFIKPFFMTPIFFWRYWNPVLSYFLYLIYINIPIKSDSLRTVIVFSFSGLVFHDLIIPQAFLGNTFSFILISIVLLFIRKFDSMKLKSFSISNLILNFLIILVCFSIGFFVDSLFSF